MSVLLECIDLQKFIEACIHYHNCSIYTDEKIVDVHDYLFNSKKAKFPQPVARLKEREWKNNEELRSIWLAKLKDFKAEQKEQLDRGYIRIA
ncbi:Protein CBG25706 [Caenorhabditis briggsae]|uniref:Uncharacterized protein n=2 Tax=Caenorhabditis briggsae TaxID=6238 RepID=A0AAE9EF03_CAEBR|nr:Protein CBG25706 [Caenorhabditis briggsae]UMM20149.1 hypothetical protein L5515_015501 [Caenorhabditis briggsae]CAR99149.1 Protein CBG25706 [Caenorhabditis briggsae]